MGCIVSRTRYVKDQMVILTKLDELEKEYTELVKKVTALQEKKEEKKDPVTLYIGDLGYTDISVLYGNDDTGQTKLLPPQPPRK